MTRALDNPGPNRASSASSAVTLSNSATVPSITRAMIVTVQIPGLLREYCGGAADLSLSAASVGAALDEIARRHASLYRNVCDETGSVRRHINLFVNDWHIRDRNGLDTSLEAGDVVTILPAISGG